MILEREAEDEMLEAARYYDEQQAGLGADLLDKVDVAIDEVGADPARFGFYRGSKLVRSIRLERFPYRLLFVLEPDRVAIVAVMHLHRHPNYWKHRLS
ncbi:MAG: type II toxin-antitoxin system RelE/ParE family toxin [Limisphaerales bacterium]